MPKPFEPSLTELKAAARRVYGSRDVTLVCGPLSVGCGWSCRVEVEAEPYGTVILAQAIRHERRPARRALLSLLNNKAPCV